MTTTTIPQEYLEPIGPVPSAVSIYEDYLSLMLVCSDEEKKQLNQLDDRCFKEIYHPHPTHIFSKNEFITYLMDRMKFVNMCVQTKEGDLATEEDVQMVYSESADFFRNYFTNQDMELMVKISQGGMTPESYTNLWSGMVDQKNFTFRKD